MDASISRRSFVKGSLIAGAGAALSPFLGATAALAGPGHPLTKAYAPDVLQSWIPALYDAVRVERLSPPNAARVYAYFGVAAYEAAVGGMPQHLSLGGQLNDLPALPRPRPNLRYDWPTVINAAVGMIIPDLLVGRDTSILRLAEHAADIAEERLGVVNDAQVTQRSNAHGRAIAAEIGAWIWRDGWQSIQGLPFTPPVGEGLWVRTPPRTSVRRLSPTGNGCARSFSIQSPPVSPSDRNHIQPILRRRFTHRPWQLMIRCWDSPTRSEKSP